MTAGAPYSVRQVFCAPMKETFDAENREFLFILMERCNKFSLCIMSIGFKIMKHFPVKIYQAPVLSVQTALLMMAAQ